MWKKIKGFFTLESKFTNVNISVGPLKVISRRQFFLQESSKLSKAQNVKRLSSNNSKENFRRKNLRLWIRLKIKQKIYI